MVYWSRQQPKDQLGIRINTGKTIEKEENGTLINSNTKSKLSKRIGEIEG